MLRCTKDFHEVVPTLVRREIALPWVSGSNTLSSRAGTLSYRVLEVPPSILTFGGCFMNVGGKGEMGEGKCHSVGRDSENA